MFVCIEGSVCHIYAHGTSPEKVIVDSAEIQHPEAKAPLLCDSDPKLVLGDFQYYKASAVIFDIVTSTSIASEHASASFLLESGPSGPSIKEGVQHTSTDTRRYQAPEPFQIRLSAV